MDLEIKILTPDELREKVGGEMSKTKKLRQKALNYYNKMIADELVKTKGDACVEVDTQDDNVWRTFGTDAAEWAFDKLMEEYKKAGYNVQRYTFSDSYHIKRRGFIELP